MEYYIYFTYDCNLRCSYCASKEIFSSPKSLVMSDEKTEEIIDYISKHNNGKKDHVVFFGGEPLLEREKVERFIKRTQHLDLSYSIYTNGLLINKVSNGFFSYFDAVFVSIDGDKHSHEIHRGTGTYDKIVDNLKDLSIDNDLFTIGRITVEEETNLFKSVTNLSKYVKAIHWQIVNKPNFKDSYRFEQNYKESLSNLFEFWMNKLRNGIVLNVIPFQAVASHFLFNHNNNDLSFRCGTGNSFQAVDIEGNVYWCDEHVGNSNGVVGNINDNNINLNYNSHKDVFVDCKTCNVEEICLGRCKKSLMESSDDHNRVYCRLTKHLIDLVYKNLDEISSSLIKYNYNDLNSFYDIPACTEEIP